MKPTNSITPPATRVKRTRAGQSPWDASRVVAAKREPGRGHYDKDRPAMIAWVSRQGPIVVHAVKDFTVKTVQQAADLAVQAGSRLYTDSASSYQALKGYVHAFVNHAQGIHVVTAHENRAGACSPCSSLTFGCFVASANATCQGTSGSFNSCGTFVNGMPSSRRS